jgi:hypothetical protein
MNYPNPNPPCGGMTIENIQLFENREIIPNLSFAT